MRYFRINIQKSKADIIFAALPFSTLLMLGITG